MNDLRPNGTEPARPSLKPDAGDDELYRVVRQSLALDLALQRNLAVRQSRMLQVRAAGLRIKAEAQGKTKLAQAYGQVEELIKQYGAGEQGKMESICCALPAQLVRAAGLAGNKKPARPRKKPYKPREEGGDK